MSKDFYEDYDRLIPLICPDYEYCLELMAKNIPDDADSLLDLGCGTGNVILYMLNNNKNLKVWGIELQEPLVKLASKKLVGKDVKLICGDILKCKWPHAQIVTSSLTIHHMDHKEKKDIFKRIYENSDYFLFFDLIKGKDDMEDEKNLKYILDFMRSNGLSEEFIEKAKEDMAENDKPLTLDEQNKIFEEIGFDYKVLYHKNGLAVYSCSRKS